MNEDLLAKVCFNEKSQGGTESLFRQIYSRVPRALLEGFQIWPSRYNPALVDPAKIQVLYVHDLPNDPMYEHLRNGGWRKFHKIVFVSHWQQQQFINTYTIPWSRCAVVLNAIIPIPMHKKPTDVVRLIYFSTPQRGLQILVPVFQELCKKYDNLELIVASSFKLYGWEEKDLYFTALFDACRNDPKITYVGSVDRSEITRLIQQSHILAYPSIWPETSCMVLMEAMSGGLLCVHPDFAALPETAANWTYMYHFHEDINQHAVIFYKSLDRTIQALRLQDTKLLTDQLHGQKMYADIFYSWGKRGYEWIEFLETIKHLQK